MAGVTRARYWLLGAKTLRKRLILTRGSGTSAASLAMTNRQECQFGGPEVARRVAHKDVRHQIQRLENYRRRAIPAFFHDQDELAPDNNLNRLENLAAYGFEPDSDQLMILSGGNTASTLRAADGHPVERFSGVMITMVDIIMEDTPGNERG